MAHDRYQQLGGEENGQRVFREELEEEDVSQDIDLEDEDTETGTKIDVESDSDDAASVFPFGARRGPHRAKGAGPESDIIRMSESAITDREECAELVQRATGRVRDEEATELEDVLLQSTQNAFRKRKYSSVKGFSIENIIGHNKA